MTNPSRELPHGWIDVVTAPTSAGDRQFDAFSPAPLQTFSGDYDADSSAYYIEAINELSTLPQTDLPPANITQAREASASCSIESIYTTTDDILLQSLLPTKPNLPTQQGIFCQDASSAIADRPIDHQSILDAQHRLLARDPDYYPRQAGQYRTTPVFIVSGGQIVHCMAPPHRLEAREPPSLPSPWSSSGEFRLYLGPGPERPAQRARASAALPARSGPIVIVRSRGTGRIGGMVSGFYPDIAGRASGGSRRHDRQSPVSAPSLPGPPMSVAAAAHGSRREGSSNRDESLPGEIPRSPHRDARRGAERLIHQALAASAAGASSTTSGTGVTGGPRWT